MIEVKESNIKELVIHYAVEESLEDLILSRVTPSGISPLFWCDGVLFYFYAVPFQGDVITDYLKNNRVHWMEAHYTKMDEYKPVIAIHDEILNNQVKVRVFNTSRSELHKAFASWVKNRG